MEQTMNKKGIMPIMIFVVLAMITIYLILYLPFFKVQRLIVNYFLIIILWVIVQIFLIWSYFKLGVYATKLFNFYKNSIVKFSFKIKKYLITKHG